MNDLGDLLTRLRGKLSLREAAVRSGLSYSYISSLEKGKHPRTGAPINPTPDILRSLAKAYNHPYDELMKLAGYMDEDGNVSSIEETKRKNENEYYANLISSIEDPVKKDQAIAFLKFLANSPTDGAKK